MFEKFDERTVANMQVALNRACERLPPGEDNHDRRKRIAQKIIDCADAGRTTLGELTEAAMSAL